MNAICFKCGNKKTDPLVACEFCGFTPESKRDRVFSFVFCEACLGEKQLRKAGKYIRKKGKLPKTQIRTLNKAQRLLNRSLQPTESVQLDAEADLNDSPDDVDDSCTNVEFPSDFFDYQPEDDGPENQVLVHVIGKSASGETRHNKYTATYHTTHWTIGEDISQADFEESCDPVDRCLYAWYQWGEGKWATRLVDREFFKQLKEMEDVTVDS